MIHLAQYLQSQKESIEARLDYEYSLEFRFVQLKQPNADLTRLDLLFINKTDNSVTHQRPSNQLEDIQLTVEEEFYEDLMTQTSHCHKSLPEEDDPTEDHQGEVSSFKSNQI
jgi:hypothetical protein